VAKRSRGAERQRQRGAENEVEKDSNIDRKTDSKIERQSETQRRRKTETEISSMRVGGDRSRKISVSDLSAFLFHSLSLCLSLRLSLCVSLVSFHCLLSFALCGRDQPHHLHGARKIPSGSSERALCEAERERL
jgi:hypothetical protein